MSGTNGDRPQGWQYRLHNYRCGGCGRLLFRGYMIRGSIVEVKCVRCARVNSFGTAVLVPLLTTAVLAG